LEKALKEHFHRSIGAFSTLISSFDPVFYRGVPETNTPHNGGYAARYKATAGFLKIPESEISLSHGLLVQNPGWGADAEYNGWK